jgi:Fe-S oxidoreductase
MADTFTRTLRPAVGDAALRVLGAAGERVAVVDPGCCGRAALSAGRIGLARRQARRALDRLAPHAAGSLSIVVLEPSCLSTMRNDYARLLPRDPRIAWIAEAAVSFASAAATAELPALRPAARRVVIHEHCHSAALDEPDALRRAVERVPGIEAVASGAGCCGMAGAFGYRHPGLSRRIAEQRLLPAARRAELVVADGMSCRHQVDELVGVPTAHPAELLAEALP